MTDWSSRHRLIESLFADGLDAVEPRSAVHRAMSYDGLSLMVSGRGIPLTGRVIVIAVGKAASRMAAGAHDVLGGRIDSGIVLTKDDHLEFKTPGFELFEARHPLPDHRGIAATNRILEVVAQLDAGDVVLALISGGGSALLESPKPGISLADFQNVTDLLLRAGAPIHHLNAVRSVISQVKGGGLRRAIGAATCVSLILSDVLGNDPTVIASGPTVLATTDAATARSLVETYGVAEVLPLSIARLLHSNQAVASNIGGTNDVWHIIADNGTLLDAVASAAVQRGLIAEIVWRDREGEARDLGTEFTRLTSRADCSVDVLIGGGEATVRVSGAGRGGRNTEFALAAAIELERSTNRDWVIASIGSDGQDGSADAAGAIADPETTARAASVGVSAMASLGENDSAGFFREVGGLVTPGPTGTNVNDVFIAIRAN